MGAKKVISAVITAVAVAVVGALPVFGDDPCSQANGTALNASATGVRTWNGTVNATTVGGSGDDAYGVEAWTEAGGTATKLTWYGPNQGGGYAFRAEWTNSTDYLGRFGYFWGSGGKKWNNLGDLCVDYNYKRSANGTGGSYSYLGIYGWTIGSSNSAEYYIVEDWFGSGQQAANNLGSNCQTHGNITVDGKTYQVVTCIRPQGSGCVSCNNQAFGQVFSIRQGMANNSNKCGTISIKKHFEEWTKMTTEKSDQSPAKYIYDKTYESKFLAEAAGGTGWFDASYMKFSRTGGCGVTIPSGNKTLTVNASPSNGGRVTRSPDSSSYSNNKSVTVTATASSGWAFDGWDGDASGTTNPLTVTMNANKTITAKFVPVTSGVTTNFVKNGNFASTSDWTLNKWQNSSGTFAVSGGNANITGIGLPSGEGAAAHSLQLVQNGIQLVNGVKYQVSFEASAASTRSIGLMIQMDIDPWTGYFSKDTVNLTTTKQAFTYEFEMKAASDDNARIAFNFGNATPNVTISNVKITYASSTGIASDRRLAPSSSVKPTLRATQSASGVKVSFKAAETGAATLRLYNIKGDVISTANLQTVSGKSYTQTLNSSGGKLPGGFYIVGLQRGSGAVERMAVLVQ
jgi:uncharacterized repeat protein (TIGR02543 family)